MEIIEEKSVFTPTIADQPDNSAITAVFAVLLVLALILAIVAFMNDSSTLTTTTTTSTMSTKQAATDTVTGSDGQKQYIYVHKDPYTIERQEVVPIR